jgi:hypothetical protein
MGFRFKKLRVFLGFTKLPERPRNGFLDPHILKECVMMWQSCAVRTCSSPTSLNGIYELVHESVTQSHRKLVRPQNRVGLKLEEFLTCWGDPIWNRRLPCLQSRDDFCACSRANRCHPLRSGSVTWFTTISFNDSNSASMIYNLWAQKLYCSSPALPEVRLCAVTSYPVCFGDPGVECCRWD